MAKGKTLSIRVRCGSASVFALLALGGNFSAWAQVPSPPGGVTVIRPMDNGYADLMEACAALDPEKPVVDASPDAPPPPATPMDRAQNQGATLADKRAALREPRVRNALALLRVALSKPRIEPPAPSLGTDPFPAMARLRELARILGIEEYVQLADGSTASAIDTLEESLALADASQHWSMIGAMVGQAMTAIAIKPISTHLDRLSAGDCSRLLSLLKTELEVPNPAIAGIHAETAVAETSMQTILTGLAGPPNAITDAQDATLEAESAFGTGTPTVAELRMIRSMQAEQGDGWKAFMAAVARQVAQQNDSMEVLLADYPNSPPVSTEALPQTDMDRLAAKFARITTIDIRSSTKMIDKSVLSRAQLRLLAVHAAIHRYQWEHNALPESLAVLKLGPLTNDPFLVNGVMRYEWSKDGKGYALSCTGPPVRDDEGKPVAGGKREALVLP